MVRCRSGFRCQLGAPPHQEGLPREDRGLTRTPLGGLGGEDRGLTRTPPGGLGGLWGRGDYRLLFVRPHLKASPLEVARLLQGLRLAPPGGLGGPWGRGGYRLLFVRLHLKASPLEVARLLQGLRPTSSSRELEAVEDLYRYLVRPHGRRVHGRWVQVGFGDFLHEHSMGCGATLCHSGCLGKPFISRLLRRDSVTDKDQALPGYWRHKVSAPENGYKQREKPGGCRWAGGAVDMSAREHQWSTPRCCVMEPQRLRWGEEGEIVSALRRRLPGIEHVGGQAGDVGTAGGNCVMLCLKRTCSTSKARIVDQHEGAHPGISAWPLRVQKGRTLRRRSRTALNATRRAISEGSHVVRFRGVGCHLRGGTFSSSIAVTPASYGWLCETRRLVWFDCWPVVHAGQGAMVRGLRFIRRRDAGDFGLRSGASALTAAGPFLDCSSCHAQACHHMSVAWGIC